MFVYSTSNKSSIFFFCKNRQELSLKYPQSIKKEMHAVQNDIAQNYKFYRTLKTDGVLKPPTEVQLIRWVSLFNPQARPKLTIHNQLILFLNIEMI